MILGNEKILIFVNMGRSISTGHKAARHHHSSNKLNKITE